MYLTIPVQDLSSLTMRMRTFNHHKMQQDVTLSKLQAASPVQNTFKNRHWAEGPRLCLCLCAGGVQWSKKIRSFKPYTAYFAYFAYFETFLSQHGLMSVSPPSCTSTVNNHKYCMTFQYLPYLDAYHLFHWERLERYPLKCRKNQPIFQELPVINPITVAMDVGAGT